MNLKNLIDSLNSPDEADRLYAAEDMGTVNTAAAVAALAARLRLEPSRAVKEAIFNALGRITDDSVMPTAILLINSDDAFVRNEAVRLLGTRGPKAMPVLARAFASPVNDMRKFALDAMATIESDLKHEIYRTALGDADINVVITAVEYIARENCTALRDNVETVLDRATHPMLIAACVEALSQIGNAGSLDATHRMAGGDLPPAHPIAPWIPGRHSGRLGPTNAERRLISR
jgi:HEAT repeat protein